MTHPLVTYLRIRHSEPCPAVHVCTVTGEIDLYSVPLLRDALEDAEQRAGCSLVVDLSGVEFLGLVGVRALLTAARRAERQRHSFSLVVANVMVRRVLELSGAGGELLSHPSLPAALRARTFAEPVCSR